MSNLIYSHWFYRSPQEDARICDEVDARMQDCDDN